MKIKFIFLLFRKIPSVGSTRFPKVRGPHIKLKVVLQKKEEWIHVNQDSFRYRSTEPADVLVKPGGKMFYCVKGRLKLAEHSYHYSKKHRGLFIVGGGGRWRLDCQQSTDDRLVWKNLVFQEGEQHHNGVKAQGHRQNPLF